jgi:hypothetical protein
MLSYYFRNDKKLIGSSNLNIIILLDGYLAKAEERTIPKKENLILNLRISSILNELLEAELDKVAGLSKSQLVRTILSAHFAEKAKKALQIDY